MERLSTGVPTLDRLIEGGIPRGFFVAAVGEPGTGKTILCLHYINEGIEDGDLNIYVTTEESRESIINQAKQFGFDFNKAIKEKRLIIIDALLGGGEWSIRNLEIEELVDTIIKAKKELGYGRTRLVIDSLSAFWLNKPAMARSYSYNLKRILSKWDFTIMVTSQYAITTQEAFGFGVEHVADGILRFRRAVIRGVLKRYILIEKMRQTNHSLYLHEVHILPGKGMIITAPTQMRKEDIVLPKEVMEKIKKASMKFDLG